MGDVKLEVACSFADRNLPQFPEGLYGGNSAAFVVPVGTPAPTGNPGHITVHDLNKPSSTCQGPMCR
ncbi:hypothetical protein SAMN02787076_02048 [Rhizobacter sp. OV335]|nr:hypothetical protein SAMN02787076_02048 [Rhizobacter sp. OV335]